MMPVGTLTYDPEYGDTNLLVLLHEPDEEEEMERYIELEFYGEGEGLQRADDINSHETFAGLLRELVEYHEEDEDDGGEG